MIPSLRGVLRGVAGPRKNVMHTCRRAASSMNTSSPDVSHSPSQNAVQPNIIDTTQRLYQFRNGERVKPTFSSAEMDARLAKLRTFMANANLDAVVLTSIHNTNYFTDFLYCSFGRTYGVVVTQDNATTISAGIDGGQPWRRSHGGSREADRQNIIYTDWIRDNFYHAVSELAPGAKRVGVEYDHATLSHMQKFRVALGPDCELVDVAEPIMSSRMVKSAEEITLIKENARIADVGGFACVKAIAELGGAQERGEIGRKPLTEAEVALASTGAMVREISKTFPHKELMDSWTWFQSGINTDGAHNPVTSRAIQKGDILSLNTFPMVAGYYVALERTLFYDHVDEASLKIWENNVKVHERGLELLKPGAKCSEVAKELNEMYRSMDLLQYRSFGYGHSFGVLCHYYGREAGLELREDVETVLKPGMVVSMEPMVSIPEGLPGAGGYREHDILVIKEDGNENITKFPYGPEHNVIKPN